MIIEYEGESYDFEFDDIGVKAAIKIEKHTGLTLTEWGDALAPDPEKGETMNMVAIQALGWLVLFGGKGAVDDTDFKLLKFAQAVSDALTKMAEAEKAAGPGPTAAVPASNGQIPDAAAASTVLSSVTE